MPDTSSTQTGNLPDKRAAAPVYWRVEGSLLELSALRQVGFFTWNARSFAEFVSEIHAGRSTILFLPQYREPMALRILEAGRDILRPYPEYPGREHWADRIFYRCDDLGMVVARDDLGATA